MADPVGVVGASARAAVHSLARAGLSAWAVDLFADRDLARVAPCAVCPLADYPATLPRLARAFPPGPVLYTGGLENHPAVVAELADERELWGNRPGVLERVRDPWRLFPLLAASGFAVPRVAPRGTPCPADGRWLRKPLRSSAGLGIRFARPGEPPSESHCFQEFLDGTPMSAVFHDTKLSGMTEQLVGLPWLHAKRFSYCGSVTRAPRREPVEWLAQNLGTFLGAEFHRGAFNPDPLRGVWNIDFLLEDGRPFVVEVNPRYSASVEVLEHATGRPVWASGGRQPPVGPPQQGADAPRSPKQDVIGKAIYYAPRDITFPDAGPWDADLAGEFDPWRLPAFADIPAPGAVIPAGSPVVTLFASGSSPRECRQALESRAGELDRLLAGHAP